VEGEKYVKWEETLRPGHGSFLDMTILPLVAWAELPADVVKEDTLAERQVARRRRRPRGQWTEERVQEIREKKGLSDALSAILTEDYSPEKPFPWMMERLVPEDYSPKVAAEERRARREIFLEEVAEERKKLEEEGAAYVAWPSERRWPAEELWTAAFKRRMVQRMLKAESKRKGEN